MSDDKKAFSILVKGRVQGVGFRFFVLQQARLYFIKGWTRNISNGSVEVHAEGNILDLEKFVKQLQMGPSSAQVTEVLQNKANVQRYKDFNIVS